MNSLRLKFLQIVVVVLTGLTTAGFVSAQSSFDLRSPDKRIEIRIRTIPQIRYDVVLNGRALMEESTLSLDVDHKKLGINPRLFRARNAAWTICSFPP